MVIIYGVTPQHCSLIASQLRWTTFDRCEHVGVCWMSGWVGVLCVVHECVAAVWHIYVSWLHLHALEHCWMSANKLCCTEQTMLYSSWHNERLYIDVGKYKKAHEKRERYIDDPSCFQPDDSLSEDASGRRRSKYVFLSALKLCRLNVVMYIL